MCFTNDTNFDEFRKTFDFFLINFQSINKIIDW